MNAFDRPWCIAGGWAIDLWLGRVTRGHAGVEVAVFRDDQIALREFLHDWRWFVEAGDPRALALKPLRRGDRQMFMAPVNTLRGQNAHGRHLAFMLDECDSVDWLYRRDRRVRWPREQWSLRGGFGVPVLSPHLVLLYKSSHPRDRDALDFRSSLPHLDSELRAWLADAISLSGVVHAWSDPLSAARA